MPDNMAVTKQDLMGLGLFSGVTDLAFAIMEQEETDTVPPKYGDVMLLGENVETGLTPTYAEGKQSASNRSVREARIMTSLTLRATASALHYKSRAAVLGRPVDSSGVEAVSDAMPPLCAVRYAGTRDDGTQLIRWILKCRASELTVTDKTSESGSIAYQLPIIEFQGVRRADAITTADGQKVHPIVFELDTARPGVTDEQIKTFMDAVPTFTLDAPTSNAS